MEDFYQLIALSAIGYALFRVYKTLRELANREHSHNVASLKSRHERSTASEVITKLPYFLNKDKLFIYWSCWEPAEEPKAVIVLSHGLNQHTGRYLHLIEHLRTLGYKIYSMDHQGHGQSEGDRLYVKCMQDFVDDLIILVRKAKDENPKKKVFLLGHSMGGQIAHHTTVQVQNLLDGLILSAPAVYFALEKVPDYTINLFLLLGRLLPKFRPSRGGNLTLCHDRELLDFNANDPLGFRGGASIALIVALLNGGKIVAEQNCLIKIPVLLIHGDEDTLIRMKASEDVFDKISSEDKEIKIYEGGFHESFNEPEHLDYAVKDVVEWLQKHL